MPALLPFRDINVHASDSHYAFSSPSTPDAPTLVVERPSGDLRLHDGKLLGSRRVSAVAGILGIITLRLDKYIIVITKANPVGRLKGNMVYMASGTEFLPLRERPLHDLDEDRYLSIVKELLKASPLYFSYSFDVTNTFQRQADSDMSLPLWKRADDRFFWNRFIQSDLIDLRNDAAGRYGRQTEQAGVDPYILPVMFGMLEIRNTSVKGAPFAFVLISRRSRHRAGTRYFSRGIDENGNVSNFNETEQAIILNDEASRGPISYAGAYGVQEKSPGRGRDVQVLSYVQTRGSVPVYWAEINTLKYIPRLQIRGVESAILAAKRHFDQQLSIYGEQYLVNLVKRSGREQAVKEAYEQMVRNLVSSASEAKEANNISPEKFHSIEMSPGAKPKSEFDHLHYIYFDFHNETKGLQWHRAALLLDRLAAPVLKHGYFHSSTDPTSGATQVRSRQTAVVRTNCMDCLDRTNVVQGMLAKFVLTRQLQDVGILPNPGQRSSVDLTIEDPIFAHLFRNVWADNADVVSRAYSGTGALKTDFTRTGMRTKRGMLNDGLNSTTRYIKNNFLDGPRQDAYDVFLGAFSPQVPGGAGAFVDQRPLVVQAVPYVIVAAVGLMLLGSISRRGEDAASVWPLRVIMVVCFVVVLAGLRFVVGHGMLYVNWPKLNTPPWAAEGYQDAMGRVRKTPVIGELVRGHERGKSEARLGFLEEGKKRIE